MMKPITKGQVLSATHYGLGVYAHILRKYYPGETVIHLNGRDCGLCRNPFANDEPTLHIWCPQIGPGAHFEHNYATYLNAESIGSNFYCLQMVTLGNDAKMQRPTIGNDVKIFTGATVFGGITIGNHVTIGAGAVVSKDVPDNCTVAGNPAYIIKKDGQKCKIEL